MKPFLKFLNFATLSDTIGRARFSPCPLHLFCLWCIDIVVFKMLLFIKFCGLNNLSPSNLAELKEQFILLKIAHPPWNFSLVCSGCKREKEGHEGKPSDTNNNTFESKYCLPYCRTSSYPDIPHKILSLVINIT